MKNNGINLPEGHCWWVDQDNTLHIDAVAVCKHLGLPPTSANQDMVLAQVRKLADTYPVEIEEVDDSTEI